jgi:hypothetical protein
MFSNICKKMNENEQHHFKNENIFDQKISDLDTKHAKKKEEETEEPCKTPYKCRECS